MKSKTLTSAVRVLSVLLLVSVTCFRPGAQASALQRPDQRLFTPDRPSKAALGRCTANGRWMSTRNGEPLTSQPI